MKTYTLDEIIENYRADIDEFVCDEYVPADVAKQLYDALKIAVAGGKYRRLGQEALDAADREDWG